MVNSRAKGRARKHPRTYTWMGEAACSPCMQDKHERCSGVMSPGSTNHKDRKPCECGHRKSPA